MGVFHPEFVEDLRYWVHTNRKITLRAFDLIQAVLRDPSQVSANQSLSNTYRLELGRGVLRNNIA